MKSAAIIAQGFAGRLEVPQHQPKTESKPEVEMVYWDSFENGRWVEKSAPRK